MRLAAYAGVSTVLAAGIILRAFHERPNFYSATVYLAQSSACRMILLNLLLLTAYGVMRALQKLLYGPLRAIEREQLWDKAWYAVTETALAMTTFREEVGAWFFVMFVSLLAGKVWGWLSEARVEALEQQPPANPRLFHIRLTISLAVSEIFDFLMLRYCVQTLLDQPRPGMMVMFAFEFAVLAITSTSTTMKYLLALQEKFIIRKQTKARIEERRQEIRLAREEAQQERANVPDGEPSSAPGEQIEEEIDENEIDVPGWQEKGRWVLFLDLLTDLLKLLVYMCFFTILLMFHGIPIHIIRDVFLTTRSFLKRIADFLKYRNATRDMNARYPDATLEELARDGTCIICREEMRPWQPPPDQAPDGAANRRPSRMIIDERHRPKKLPCGHILHFGCLRSWLERQQVCPTCRSSVLAPSPNRETTNRPDANQGIRGPGQQPGGAQAPDQNRPGARPNVRRARTFNVGPWRIAVAAGDEQQVREALQALRDDNHAAAAVGQLRAAIQGAQNGPLDTTAGIHGTNVAESNQSASHGLGSLQEQIARIEEQLAREFSNLALAEQQLTVVRGLQQELERLRDPNNSIQIQSGQVDGVSPPYLLGNLPQRLMGPVVQPHSRLPGQGGQAAVEQQIFTASAQQVTLGPGHSDLPAGFSLPDGWTLLPLEQSATQELQDHDQQLSSHIEQVVPQLPFPSVHESPSSLTYDTPSDVTPILHPSERTVATETGNNLGGLADPPSQPFRTSHPPSQPAFSLHNPLPEANEETRTEQESPSDIPNWGNSSQGPLPGGEDSSQDRPASEHDGSPRANGSMGDMKGKAKSVTVEDVEDEDDT